MITSCGSGITAAALALGLEVAGAKQWRSMTAPGPNGGHVRTPRSRPAHDPPTAPAMSHAKALASVERRVRRLAQRRGLSLLIAEKRNPSIEAHGGYMLRADASTCHGFWRYRLRVQRRPRGNRSVSCGPTRPTTSCTPCANAWTRATASFSSRSDGGIAQAEMPGQPEGRAMHQCDARFPRAAP